MQSAFVFLGEFNQRRGMNFTRRFVFRVKPGHWSACFVLSEKKTTFGVDQQLGSFSGLEYVGSMHVDYSASSSYLH